MIEYTTELHGTMTCDKCKATLPIFESAEMCTEIDADWEIEILASDNGWEVAGDEAICYDCLLPEEAS